MLTPFERAARQLAAGERELRSYAEARLQEYLKLLVEIASNLLAPEFDACLRQNPQFAEQATPADWRAFFNARQTQSVAAWGAVGSAEQQREIDRLQAALTAAQAQVARLQAELRQVRALNVRSGSAQPPEAAQPDPSAGQPAPPAAPAEPPEALAAPAAPARLPPAARPGADRAAANRPPPLGYQSDWKLPKLPLQAPQTWASSFTNWARQGLALAILAATGFSVRQEIGELLARELARESGADVNARAGSVRRMLAGLAENGFCHEQLVTLAGLRRAEGENDTTLMLTRLTDQGRQALLAAGITAVLSEWESLHAQHGGGAQIAHTGLVCAFTYQARLRGWATAVCPSVAPPAEPDVLLRMDGVPDLYVEVEAESGTDERRMHKWCNQIALQGQAALVAVTPEMQVRLVDEARKAGAEHGVATDLQTLVHLQAGTGPLWATSW